MRNEDDIRGILDNLPIGIAIHSIDPTISFDYFNDNFLKYFRTTADALAEPDGFWDNVFEDRDFREKIKARVIDDYHSGDPDKLHWENIPITREGEDTTYVTAKSFATPGKDLMITTVADVTRRKNTEDELRASQIKLGEAMDIAHLVNWEFDVATQTFTFDNRFYSLYGSTEELEGNKMTAEDYAKKFVHPDDQYMVAEEVEKAIKTTDPDFKSEVEHRIIRKDGEIRNIIVRFGVIKDREGRTIATRGANQDITERKIAEEELKKSKEKYKDLVENVSDAIFTFDLEGRITYINPVVERLYGFTPDEVIGHKFSEYLHPDDVQKALAEFRHRLEGHYHGENMYRIFSKDGSVRFIRTTQTPIVQKGKITGFNYIMTDLTDRIKAEEALSITNNKLNMLSSITRHDILNKIMAVTGYIEISEDLVDNPELQKYIEKEKEAVRAIEHQIEFTRFYQDIGMVEPVWHNTEEIVNLSASTLDIKGIELDNSLKGVEIFCDPLIEKVFYNLMDNSLRHGGDVTAISLSYAVPDDKLVISYRDNGVGISDEDREKLFRKGFGKNTGLGLFLSREILSITEIEITEKGREGEGVNFEISVPKGNYRFVQ